MRWREGRARRHAAPVPCPAHWQRVTMTSAMNDSDATQPVEPAASGVADDRSAATHLARNLAARRRAPHLTQDALARAAAVPRSTIANLESGAGNPSLVVLVKVAHAL